MDKNLTNRKKNVKIKILLVDDHPLVREGLKSMIDTETDFMVCGECDKGISTLEGIKEMKQDIVILDVSLGDISGIKLIPIIKKQFPNLHILILSMHNENEYAIKALDAGAEGYIMKQDAHEKLFLAIRKIISGEIYLSENIIEDFNINLPEKIKLLHSM